MRYEINTSNSNSTTNIKHDNAICVSTQLANVTKPEIKLSPPKILVKMNTQSGKASKGKYAIIFALL